MDRTVFLIKCSWMLNKYYSDNLINTIIVVRMPVRVKMV